MAAKATNLQKTHFNSPRSYVFVVSFSRKSLISNEQKYRAKDSLEYRMFMAENPEYAKNQTLGPS